MITFSTHSSGLPLLILHNAFSTAEITSYGAHILSWTPSGGENVLFLSDKSVFTPGKAIRGGIPVCWPWFGPHATNSALPTHGFARILQWTVVRTEDTAESTTAVFECVSGPETLALWPHEFRLNLSVSAGKTLDISLTTFNPGKESFTITDALHTYFNVSDIANASVEGLDGVKFLDRVGAPAERVQSGSVLVSGETNRVYYSSAPCSVSDSAFGRSVAVSTKGFPDTVVWNPWVETSKTMPDFGDEEFHRMVCVEAGSVFGNSITVASGSSISQKLSLAPAKAPRR